MLIMKNITVGQNRITARFRRLSLWLFTIRKKKPLHLGSGFSEKYLPKTVGEYLARPF